MSGKKLTAAEEKAAVRDILREIKVLSEGHSLRYMEVCGTHTVSIFRAGIRQMLPTNIELVSGPGCPVCVTPDSYMDKAIAYAKRPDCVIATFGDMLKVPGSESSLAEAQAEGADIRIVYSSMDCLELAKEQPDKKVIFLAVGFETTAPTAAATVLAAKEQGIRNLYMLSAHKLVPPAMRMLLDDPKVRVDGFLLPGHASVVTGTHVFDFLEGEAHKPGVVGGFTALQILRAVLRLVQQSVRGEARVENEYGSVVRPEGNPAALRIMDTVYETVPGEWRGIGMIPASGLSMRASFAEYDIEKAFPLDVAEASAKPTACRCGEVLRGVITPPECALFDKACKPTHAVGPCMVSVEGTCAAWQKYGKARFSYGA
ncbi:hydrogenase formation protein HypD [Selenomonas sp. TAMA-11512]|uniref:hydrogenase formation protein HypD n=1 Tax=Selenomonas sp. TAMA-11512 TaxID=3095337 RepID=UPI00308B73C6|nr:hydrogenase formation protein HypD [Selenomonas sp. TAMA-11512]